MSVLWNFQASAHRVKRQQICVVFFLLGPQLGAYYIPHPAVYTTPINAAIYIMPIKFHSSTFHAEQLRKPDAEKRAHANAHIEVTGVLLQRGTNIIPKSAGEK